MFVDVVLVFPLLLHSGESYGGPASVLFPHRFLHRFLVDSGIDLEVILEGFGRSKSVILGVHFCMIFACRSKSGPRAPKSALQERPRVAQERPKSAQERPKSAPRAFLGILGGYSGYFLDTAF